MSGRASRRGLWAAGAAVALAAGLALAPWLAPEAPVDARVDAAPEAGPPPLPPAAPVREVLPPVRQVIPGQEATVPGPGEAVVRLPAAPVPVPPPRAVALGVVVVAEATLLDTRAGPVRLAGTRPLAADATCALPDGRRPACATLARAAVRRFVGLKPVACTLGGERQAGDAAPCTAAGEDIALWVVGGGWAQAAGDAPQALRDAEAAARAARRGLWALTD